MYLNKAYLDSNPTWHVEDSLWKAQQIDTMLSRHKIEAASVCEIGCGAGEILKELSSIYPKTRFSGYEISPHAYELCKSRASTTVEFFMASLPDSNQKYDVLLCMDVVEHVEDYLGFLKQLKARATFHIFHIPLDINVAAILRNTMIDMRRSVGHLHYFTPATAIATLSDCGYDIVDFFFTRSFDELPSKTLKSKLVKLPRKALYAVSPHLLAKLLGGCSLLVLTK